MFITYRIAKFDNLFKKMIVFVVVHKGEVFSEVFTSLSMACENFGLSYSSASKGKRVFVNDKDEVTTITEARVSKIKGRENNSSGKRNAN